MRCKKHPGDPSGDPGVCASCLRERLFVLITTQSQAELHDLTLHPPDDDCQRHSLPPIPRPQLLLPCSVSPTVVKRHRKSSSYCDQPVHLPHRPRRPFFGTPQVGPTFSSNPVYEPSDFVPVRKPSRFSLLLGFLPGNRSDRVRGAVLHNPHPTSQPSPSSSIFAFWRKKQSRASSSTAASSASAFRRKRTTVVSNRGMSPAGASDHEEDREVDGYASEDYPNSWRRSPGPFTPMTTARRKTTNTPHPRNLPGFVFCLSPMVRASPSGNRGKKACVGAAEVGLSGEVRVAPAKGRRQSVDAALCKNRSRKLADMGRGAHNR
ncbi:hypothetical protein MLD38_010865 [Melastoma candidum]|uniref:Uncharacterized protein n=1 Tax=Melastoma candidum TaxID=119954 RepID=A0ACB9R2J1_9MYRT|nr:hypothetical protein MLD38_010865 [Melastoma candidum]